MSRVECDHCGARYELPSEANLEAEPRAGLPATCRECGAPARSPGDRGLTPTPLATRDKAAEDEVETVPAPVTAEIAGSENKDATDEEPTTTRSPGVYSDALDDEKTIAIPLTANKSSESAAKTEPAASEEEMPPISATPSMETLIERVRPQAEKAGKSGAFLEGPRYDLRPPDILVEVTSTNEKTAPSMARARALKTDAPVAGTRPPPPKQSSSRAGLFVMLALSAGGVFFATRGLQNNDGSSDSAVQPPPPTLNDVAQAAEAHSKAAATPTEPGAALSNPAAAPEPAVSAAPTQAAPTEPAPTEPAPTRAGVSPEAKQPLPMPQSSKQRERAVVPASLLAEPRDPAFKPSDLPPTDAAFDANAANAALGAAAAQASTCRKTGDPSGTATVTITFSTSGRVTSATISGPPFAGTETGSCIASRLRGARVPAFAGEFITVKKTVAIQ